MVLVKKVHDSDVRVSLKQRVQSLRPDSPRQWGKMTVDQMLWHVNVPMKESLGEYSTPAVKAKIPLKMLRWLVLNAPWPRGAPTRPDLVAKTHYDFEQERSKCVELLDRFVARDINGKFPNSALLGEMSGTHWSRLHAKHVDHHLRQFGA